MKLIELMRNRSSALSFDQTQIEAQDLELILESTALAPDACLALQNATLMAETLGYATRIQSGTWLRTEAKIYLLQLPDHNIPCLILMAF